MKRKESALMILQSVSKYAFGANRHTIEYSFEVFKRFIRSVPYWKWALQRGL